MGEREREWESERERHFTELVPVWTNETLKYL